jgi:hypothetical protein
MQIVELGDCSMVIMKDSEDPPWVSVGDTYRKAEKYGYNISVLSENAISAEVSSDYVYTAGRLVLFFKDTISNDYHLHDKVSLELSGMRRR